VEVCPRRLIEFVEQIDIGLLRPPYSTRIILWSRQLLDDLLVDDRRTLRGPLLWGHGMIRDQILAEEVIDVLHITPTLGISVLQPDERGCYVRWTMLDVVNNNRLLGSSRHENFDGLVVIAVGALVERALDAGGEV
jgi:hypothetical protein